MSSVDPKVKQLETAFAKGDASTVSRLLDEIKVRHTPFIVLRFTHNGAATRGQKSNILPLCFCFCFMMICCCPPCSSFSHPRRHHAPLDCFICTILPLIRILLSDTMMPWLHSAPLRPEYHHNNKPQLQLLDLPSLPPTSLPTPTAQADLLAATRALEFGVLLAARDPDLSDEFDAAVAQLMPLYTPFPPNPTPNTFLVLGLRLTHLLINNRLSDFHSALETYSPSALSSPFVQWPVSLERHLMVGSYATVVQHAKNPPDAAYGPFVEGLVDAVRDNVADCLEVAYDVMDIGEVAKMMMFDDSTQASQYIQDLRSDWIVNGGVVTFNAETTGNRADDVPSMKVISQTLSYATELERIV